MVIAKCAGGPSPSSLSEQRRSGEGPAESLRARTVTTTTARRFHRACATPKENLANGPGRRACWDAQGDEGGRMRVIPTRIHGIMDYLMGALLIVAPWLFGMGRGPAMWIPIMLGAGALSYSLLTDYELGVVRTIP